MNINKFLNKEFFRMSLRQIACAPVNVFQGIGEKDAKLLRDAFNVKTVSDLAKLKYVKWAQAICLLAEGEEKNIFSYMNINKFLADEYKKFSFEQLKSVPFGALQGVGDNDAVLLKKAFRKRTLSKYVYIAQAIVTLAEAEEISDGSRC